VLSDTRTLSSGNIRPTLPAYGAEIETGGHLAKLSPFSRMWWSPSGSGMSLQLVHLFAKIFPELGREAVYKCGLPLVGIEWERRNAQGVHISEPKTQIVAERTESRPEPIRC
jgi:hypothetical protein